MRVRWTTDAADDLERICDYIAESRPESEQNILIVVTHSARLASEFPIRFELAEKTLTRVSQTS